MDELELENYCDGAFKNWQSAFFARRWTDANQICIDFINRLKPIYNNDELAGQDKTFAYIFMVLMKGLQDLAELAPMTGKKYWPHRPKEAEAIWIKLWDAKERFSFFYRYWLGGPILKEFEDILNGLESFYYDTFGTGLYFSPETIIKKSNCSVCGINIKACDHILGNIYDGVRCVDVVEDMDFRGVSIVKSPYDMRCRLWPWNMKKDRTITGMFMSLNGPDDFLKDDGKPKMPVVE